MLDPAPIPPASPEPGGPAPTAIRELLERARARQRRIVLAAAGLGALAALVGLAPLLFALAASGSSLARPLALVAVLGTAAAALGLALARARREVGDLPATARLLSERVGSPALRRGLLPAFELAEELARASEPGFSRELARAHIESVAPAARTADLSRALPDRPVRLAARGLLAAAAVFLVLAVVFTEPIARGARLLVLGPGERAPTVARRAEPVTGEIELAYSYPAYTRLAARTVPNTNGEIAAPKGTQVRLRTRADREVAKAFVVVGEAALPLQVQGGRDLTGSLLVDAPGSYRFRFLDARGRTLVEGPPIAIAVEVDRAPKATIVAPMGDVEVDPKSQVKVVFDAEDDYGVSEIALVYKLPGATKSQRVVLQRSAQAPRRGSGEYAWDLLAPGLMPGDSVAYYLEATDNDEVSGRKTGVSKTQYLKIFSQAEHHRKMLRQVEQTWEKLVLLLADRLESPDRPREGRSADRILAQAPTDTRALEVARELRELAGELRKQKSPPGLWQALDHAGAGLTAKASATADARSALSLWLRRGIGMDSEPVRRLMRALEAEIAEEERDVLYLEALVDRQKIEDLVALSKELSAKRRDLAGLLESYRNAPDDATRDLLVREIARLKERMAQLMERMAELSKGIQDEHVNAEALKEMGKTQQMMSSFDKLQELLYQGKVEEAMKEMEKLGQTLDTLEKNLQKAAQGQNGGEPDPLARDLGDFARNLDELESGQQRLLEDTQRVKNNYKKALQERLAQKGADFVERLREKTDEARQRLRAVENPRGLYTEEELKRARESIEDLDKALAVKDFDQAEASAAKALSVGDQLAEQLEQRAADVRRYPPGYEKEAGEAQRNAQSARAALPPLAEVKKELESLQPPPSQALSAEDRQRMKDLAQRQGQLQDQAGQLQQRMDELNQQAPMFPDEAQQMMQQAQGRMSRAQGQMQARNPSGASAEQRAALDQLGELKKGLQRQKGQGQGQGQGNPVPWPWMGPGQQSGGGENGSGVAQNDQEVEIPNADQYQVPEEYRKDILDAMKQGAPEKYKDQVKRYYEEIVK